MSEESPISASDNWFLGEDKTFRFYVRTGASVVVSTQAANGATSISVEPLEEAISSAAKVRFAAPGKAGVVATLSAPAVVGDTTLAVTAIAGLIAAGTAGRKVQDVTGYPCEFVLREGPTGAVLFTKATSGAGITLSDPTNGVIDVAIVDDDTATAGGVITIQPGSYYYTLRKTQAGDESLLAFGEAVLRLGATR